jgi:predicted enzyme related to lactoylglutathione lyase
MVEMAPRVVHLELHTGNLARACAFYASLLGCGFERVSAGNGSYLAMDLGSGLGGGVVECGADRGRWLPYAEVEDIGATTARARDLGGAVLLDSREGPGGWRSVVATPDGGEIALWQPKAGLHSLRDGVSGRTASRGR